MLQSQSQGGRPTCAVCWKRNRHKVVQRSYKANEYIICVFRYIYIYMVYVNTYIKNMYSIHKYAYTSHTIDSSYQKSNNFSYIYLQLKDGSMITKKCNQRLNQKGENLDAYQGQMDSCSFCKHLPPRSPQVVKWCVSSTRGQLGQPGFFRCWTNLKGKKASNGIVETS